MQALKNCIKQIYTQTWLSKVFYRYTTAAKLLGCARSRLATCHMATDNLGASVSCKCVSLTPVVHIYLKHEPNDKHHCHTRDNVCVILYDELMAEYRWILVALWTTERHFSSHTSLLVMWLLGGVSGSVKCARADLLTSCCPAQNVNFNFNSFTQFTYNPFNLQCTALTHCT